MKIETYTQHKNRLNFFLKHTLILPPAEIRCCIITYYLLLLPESVWLFSALFSSINLSSHGPTESPLQSYLWLAARGYWVGYILWFRGISWTNSQSRLQERSPSPFTMAAFNVCSRRTQQQLFKMVFHAKMYLASQLSLRNEIFHLKVCKCNYL